MAVYFPNVPFAPTPPSLSYSLLLFATVLLWSEASTKPWVTFLLSAASLWQIKVLISFYNEINSEIYAEIYDLISW